ncbi:MAG: DUF1566 domain-containing protein [Spirochaetia bacterium]|nr:DUF1566 domain-containing protein [Spirochaetia bacterium]
MGNISSGASKTETALTDAGSVVDDKASLTITYASTDSALAVYQNLGLATLGPSGTIITWVATYTPGGADASAVVAADGTIARPTLTGDENITLTATISKGAATPETKTFDIVIKQIMPPIKTYQTQCWDEAGTLIDCAGTGQDGEYQRGRDVSFTGPIQHGTYIDDYTTTDNVTGLVWKSCSEGLSGADCLTGTATTHTWDTANTTTCSALNSANSGIGYAGIITWRLPTIDELKLLLNYGVNTPSTFSLYFPSTIGDFYHSSSENIPLDWEWSVGFSIGSWMSIASIPKGNNFVRCVSSQSLSNGSILFDNGNGTITDKMTNLTWQKCSMGQNNDTSCSGTATINTWQNSLNFCNSLTLAGKSWRLPNINELESIVNRTVSYPSIDDIFFPNSSVFHYWSSSTTISTNNWAWAVSFGHGGLTNDFGKYDNNYIRCVSSNESAGHRDGNTINGVNFNMRYVEGKTFPTGTDDLGIATVSNDFWIGETEVTYELWYEVYQWAISNGYTFANAGSEGYDGTVGDIPTVAKNEPVATINWRDVMVFTNALTEYFNAYKGTSLKCVYTSDATYTTCIRVSTNGTSATYGILGSVDDPYVNPSAKGFRLPTSDEWELAARYIDDANIDGDILDVGEYYPGNHISGDITNTCDASIVLGDYAWYSSNSGIDTHNVATKAANALNVYDMSGNVYEWVFDWALGSEGQSRMVRGGSFHYSPSMMSVGNTMMSSNPAYTQSVGEGFRLARNP